MGAALTRCQALNLRPGVPQTAEELEEFTRHAHGELQELQGRRNGPDDCERIHPVHALDTCQATRTNLEIKS